MLKRALWGTFSSAAIDAIGHPGKGLDPPLRAMPKCLLRYFQWCFPKLPTRENICEMSIVNCLKGKLFLRIAQGNVKSSCRMSTLFHKFMRDRNSLFYYLSDPRPSFLAMPRFWKRLTGTPPTVYTRHAAKSPKAANANLNLVIHLWICCAPNHPGKGLDSPSNQANAHLILANSSLKKCPKPSGLKRTYGMYKFRLERTYPSL